MSQTNVLVFLRVGGLRLPCEVNRNTHLGEKKIVAVIWGILDNNSKTEESTTDLCRCVNKSVLSGKYCNKPGKNKEPKSLLTSLSMEMHAKGGEDWN